CPNVWRPRPAARLVTDLLLHKGKSMMNTKEKIYVAGHRGLVGSAIVRALCREGCNNLVLRTHAELDLTNQDAVRRFLFSERPAYVFLAAAKVGGIAANNIY